MARADRYKDSGVDLEAAESAKSRIITAVESTRNALSRGRAGAFGGMLKLPELGSPGNLVMSTDGVGTKILVAIAAGRFDSIGQDLVNHCVNDILVHGARPIAFLDYIAAHTLNEDAVAAMVEGVAAACRDHDMVLVGGETAQLPDLYLDGHYDLAGTIIGIVEEDRAIHGDRIRPGDVLIGYEASGLHTNGYTLAREVVFEKMGLSLDDEMPGCAASVSDVLLAIHRSYYSAIEPVLDKVKGMAHITGGGIEGNLSRTLPDGVGAKIDRHSWDQPPVYGALAQAGDISDQEMLQVFNMGVGIIAAVGADDVDEVKAAADSAGCPTWVIGRVVEQSGVEIVAG